MELTSRVTVLHLRSRSTVDGHWYDLKNWAASHPGGPSILKLFDGKDATDAFHSLHSAEAKQRMAKLKGPAVNAKELAALTKPSKVWILKT